VSSSVASVVPGSSTSITQASWRDFNAIRHIENICFPRDGWPLWDILGVLTLPNVVRLKASQDGLAVGFIACDLRRAERMAWIATIGVLPKFRKQGIGTALIQAAEANVGLPRMRLNVRASNETAITLYKNLGYTHAGVWSRYYQDGEDALILEKILD
jgi:ribosomal-protein-alanine N-acetyltransferase